MSAMHPLRALLGIAAVALALAGCGGEPEAQADGDAEEAVASIVTPEPDPNGPLPDDVCFSASTGYELQILARPGTRELCERLADRGFPADAGRSSWPPPGLEDPDSAPAVACVVEDGSGRRAKVLEAPRGGDRTDGEAVCDRLLGDGWTPLPADDDLS
jgi:hypothetical protein